MKRTIGLLALLTVLTLAVGSMPLASAHHKAGHEGGPPGGGGGGGGGSEKPKACKSQGKGIKHCYPPPGGGESASGESANFATEVPSSGGITVGMATMIAVGALGALLVARRRWTFKTHRNRS